MKKIITIKRLTKFLSYYKPYRGIFAMDMFFACVSAVSVLLFPLVSGYITQEVLARQTPGTQKRLIGAGIVLLILLTVQVTANVIYAYFGHAMGAKMECHAGGIICPLSEAVLPFPCGQSAGKTDDGDVQ